MAVTQSLLARTALFSEELNRLREKLLRVRADGKSCVADLLVVAYDRARSASLALLRTRAGAAKLRAMSAENPIHSITAEVVEATLGKASDVDSCVALGKRINTLLSQAVESFEADGAGIACRPGCNFCCYLRVMVYPHEAIALFRHLRSKMPKEQADVVRKRITANAAQLSRIPSNTPCAFLVDGMCSAYEARPGTCSAYHSLSRDRCEAAFNARETTKRAGEMNASSEGDTVPLLEGLRYVATSIDEGLDAALAARGLSSTRIELHTALAALLKNPALIERWRSGRDLVKPP